MTDTIRFPHLGITLSHVGREISIGSFSIAYYGITIAAAMLCGILLSMRVAKKVGQDPELYFNFAILAILFSLLGARIYYVAFSWEYYGAHPLEIFNVRGGGLAIYGGVIAGMLTAVFYAKRKGISPGQLLDGSAVGLVLGQVIGRWGNFFNREAFGTYTDSLFAMQLPLDAVNSSDVTQEMLSHAMIRDGITWVQVHPTFLYESLWNLGLLAVLLIVTLQGKKKFEGELFCLYLAGYGLGRIWIEALRTDQLRIPGTTVPVSQVLSAVLIAAALGVIGYGRKRSRRSGTYIVK